jgi:hypothetical protein
MLEHGMYIYIYTHECIYIYIYMCVCACILYIFLPHNVKIIMNIYIMCLSDCRWGLAWWPDLLGT